MAYIEWNKEYNVAVKKFNDAHKELFGYINQLHQGLTSGFGISDMSFILDGLVNYTINHFRDEETLMQKYHYPDLFAHKQQHEEILKKVAEYVEDFKSGKKTFSLELLGFLNGWITDHILKTDMQYKEFFKDIAAEQKKKKEES